MSELKLSGTIKSFLPVTSGTSKVGKEWKKQNFVISNKDGYEGADKIYCFEYFGEENVNNLTKYNKVGDEVTVSYNIGCNEYNNPTKGLQYFTSLSAWRVEKGEAVGVVNEPVLSGADDDLPF